MKKSGKTAVSFLFAVVAVIAAINTAATQYGAIKEAEKLFAVRFAQAAPTYVDDGGGGDKGGKESSGPVASLTITRVGGGSADTDAGYVLANGTRVLTRLEFLATNSDITVTKMQFGASSSSTYPNGSDLGDDIADVSIRQCEGVTCTTKSDIAGLTNLPINATGTSAGTVIAERAAGFFTIPRGQSRYFTLEANLNPILIATSSWADSGTDIYALLRSTNFRATSRNRIITTFTTSTGGTPWGVQGNQKVLLRSKPVLSVARPSGTILTSGLNPIIEVTVGASENPIALKALGVNIAATGATASAPTTSNVTLTELRSLNQIAIGAVWGKAVANGSSSDLYVVLANPELIVPGSPKTYQLKVTVGGVTTSTPGTARLITRLDRNETSHVAAVPARHYRLLGTYGNYSGTAGVWVWSDLSDDATGIETNTQWENAYLVRPFPTDAITVTN